MLGDTRTALDARGVDTEIVEGKHKQESTSTRRQLRMVGDNAVGCKDGFPATIFG
jgi:hypothetical protein